MSKLITLLIFSLITLSLAQNLILPRDDAASTYIASVQSDFDLVNVGGHNGTFRCIGTFINDRSIITAASCVVNYVATPRNMFLVVSSTLRANPNDGIISGLFVVDEIHVHPQFGIGATAYNVAILKVARNPTPYLRPRKIDDLNANRFCSLLGWDGPNRNLQLNAVRITNSTVCNTLPNDSSMYCAHGTSGFFQTCNDLIGSPIICGDGTISGIIANDNFCQINSIGNVLALSDFKEWIGDVSGADKIVKVSCLAFVLLFIVMVM